MTTRLATASRPDPLAALMARVQEGDEASFRDLYDLSHVQVSRVVSRVVRAPDQSSEVLQEVFLHAWQHARSYDATRGSVLPWLAMLAHRRAVDRVRSAVRSAARDQREFVMSEQVCPDTADEGVSRHEAAHLRAAVQGLSVAQRDAVSLTYLHGYTHREAALLLGVPLGTLKTRVRAGLVRLRTLAAALAA